MRYRHGIALAVALLALPVCIARAQEAPVRPMSASKLGSVCMASLERFCPELAPLPGQMRNQTRNQVICLKPYRSSLPLACRSAVTAALR